MLRQYTFLLILLFVGAASTNAQTFKAYLTSGINASQIDGDFEVGYNKIGYTGGIGIGIDIQKQSFLSTEFLFSQRGSKDGRLNKQSPEFGNINLNYIELPIMYRLNDWYQEDDKYYKVWLEGGLSVGRLIGANFNFEEQPYFIDEIRTTDLSFIAGGGLNINKHFFVNLRYTRGIFPMYVIEDGTLNDVQSFLSHFITLRIGYAL